MPEKEGMSEETQADADGKWEKREVGKEGVCCDKKQDTMIHK